MSRVNLVLLLFLAVLLRVTPSLSDESHSHDEEKTAKESSHDEHGDKENHDEHEEENSAVGPEKGITEFHPEKGLRLSPEAIKNFGITIENVVPSKIGIEIPSKALLESQAQKYVYVESSGLLRRVPIEIVKRVADTVVVNSRVLSPKDKVVTSGVPFLRAAELDVTTGGGSHGH